MIVLLKNTGIKSNTRRAFLLAALLFQFSFLSPAMAGESHESKAWETLERKAEQAFVDGDIDKSKEYWKKALAEAESDEKQILNVATTLNQLNHLFMRTGDYKTAYRYLNRALVIRKKHLGDNNILTAETMGNLALVSHKLGHDHEAEALYLDALAIKEKLTGKDSYDCATTLHNLANLYSMHLDYAKAKAMYERVIEIDRKKHGDDHVEIVRDLTSLGINAYRCKRYKEAIEDLEKAGKIASQQKEPYKAELVPIYHYLGLACGSSGDHQKAQEYLHRAHALGDEVHGKHYPANTIAMLNLAESLDRMGKTKEAEKALLKALAHESKRPEKDDYLTTEVNLELGQYYHRHDLNEKAKRYYEAALKTYDKLPDYLRRKLYELPVAYSDLLVKIGRKEEAREISTKYLHVITPSKGKHFRME